MQQGLPNALRLFDELLPSSDLGGARSVAILRGDIEKALSGPDDAAKGDPPKEDVPKEDAPKEDASKEDAPKEDSIEHARKLALKVVGDDGPRI